jgi:hypothetical protein
MKATRWFIGTTATFLGAISSAYAATEGRGDDGGNTMIWIFLGMCALIVVGQLLPAFRATKPGDKIAESQAATAQAIDSQPANPDSPSGKGE